LRLKTEAASQVARVNRVNLTLRQVMRKRLRPPVSRNRMTEAASQVSQSHLTPGNEDKIEATSEQEQEDRGFRSVNLTLRQVMRTRLRPPVSRNKRTEAATRPGQRE
jgi:hypothetical protein